jgi:hypothetical protein
LETAILSVYKVLSYHPTIAQPFLDKILSVQARKFSGLSQVFLKSFRRIYIVVVLIIGSSENGITAPAKIRPMFSVFLSSDKLSLYQKSITI